MKTIRIAAATAVIGLAAHRTAEMVDALERMEVYRQRGDDAALAAKRKRFATTWLGKPGGPALSLP